MITTKPDSSISLARLEGEVRAFREEIKRGERWYIREKYVDRGKASDPFYILQFRDKIEDPGDDLMGEPLFATRSAALKVKRITRQKEGTNGSYWQPIAADELMGRLERFMTMYRDDFLQPPGYYGDMYKPKQEHPRFKEKRFLFRIGSGRREIISVGSKMFAGHPLFGALRGQVMDENGASIVGVIVELVSDEETISRTTQDEGLFWFSKVQPGKYNLHIKGRGCEVKDIQYEEFGNVKGWVSDNDNNPVAGAEVQLYAPDREIFSGWSNASGKFTTGPLPAFPYVMSIPGFLFTHQVTVVSDAIIGGILHDEQGKTLAGRTLILKQGDKETARETTDAKGNFMFSELLGGRYQIELPGTRLYSKEIAGGTIKGKIHDASAPMKVQLIAKEKAVIEERITSQYNFLFENVVPGNYRVDFKRIENL
ncbi:MAG: carboxypeptidase regulatory-like domain-containing protein [bacterium]|nr:carboxypeptidase regulatory-like domain-containing protein [bacterium]